MEIIQNQCVVWRYGFVILSFRKEQGENAEIAQVLSVNARERLGYDHVQPQIARREGGMLST